MSLTQELMGQGLPSGLALQLGFDTPQTGVSAAGNSQATATALVADCAIVSTVSASQGVIVPNRPGFWAVTNTSSTSLTVYPPVGSNFAGAAANASRPLAQNQTMIGFTAGTTIFALTSA